MNRCIRLFVLFCFLTTIYEAFALPKSEVIERIRPVGSVRLKDAPRNMPVVGVVVPASAITSPSPENIFGQYCTVCHQQGLAGAPRFRNAQEWGPRLAGRNLQELTASAIRGKNAMPPRGTCVKCSDDDIRKTIEYMLPRR